MPRSSVWLLLVNPAAGGGRGAIRARRVSSLFLALGIPHETAVTENAEHLISLAARAGEEGFSGVCVLGGDGSASHAASGLIGANSRLPLAVIPAGNGNDWARTLGLRGHRGAAEAMVVGRTARLDAGMCSIRSPSLPSPLDRLFVNSAGIGLDAHVLMRSLEIRRRIPFGRAAYLCSLLSTVATMPTWEADLSANGSSVYRGKYLSFTIGVCPYVGGGMMLSPSARPDDGLLDGALVKPVTRRRLLSSLPQVYRGLLLSNPAVSTWRGMNFSVRSETTLCIELDGEPTADCAGGCLVDIQSLPGVLDVVVGPDYRWGRENSAASSSAESTMIEAP